MWAAGRTGHYRSAEGRRGKELKISFHTLKVGTVEVRLSFSLDTQNESKPLSISIKLSW